MKIQIFSKENLNHRIKNGYKHFNSIISIGSPYVQGIQDLDDYFENVLRLQFHDINYKSEMPRKDHPKLVRLKDIKKIIRFYEKTKNNTDGYTVHCHAGVHRSTAAGLILLYLIHNSEKKAIEELLAIHPLPLPNKRMIFLFDKYMKSNLTEGVLELLKRFKLFLNDEIEIKRDDYLEELPDG